MLTTIAIAGGLFAFLGFIHFFADWIFQTDYQAKNKHDDISVLGKHCFVYTIIFIPFLMLIGVYGTKLVLCASLLFSSHYVIDTYTPIFLWAKFLRRIPELQKNNIKSCNKNVEQVFAELWNNPVYSILFITVDQILHLSFLWAIVVLALV